MEKEGSYSVWHAMVAVAVCNDQAEDYVWISQLHWILHRTTPVEQFCELIVTF